VAAVVWIGAPGGDDAALVGGKAAALGGVAAAARPLATIPAGFTIPGALDLEALAAALSTLGDGVRVAVRSSAREEGGAGASFAGQHETVLGVRGLEAVVAAVRRCRASARSSRATAYRAAHGLAEDPAPMPVLVQRLVETDVAVVAATAERVVMTVAPGPAAPLLAGTLTPEMRVVERDLRVVPTGGGSTLTDAQAREVAVLALALEEATGAAVEIECAYGAGTLHLLQCRGLNAPPPGAGVCWMQERTHHPEPVGALEFAVLEAFTVTGLNAAARRFALPIEVRMRHEGGYVYQATLPAPAPDGEAEGRLLAAADRLSRDWRESFLPEVRSHLAAWDAADLSAPFPAELLAQLDATLERVQRLGEIHFLVALPGLAATSALMDLHAELFPRDAPLAVHGLLRGFDSLTLAGDSALVDLGRHAREAGDEAARGALDALLTDHGHRSDARSPLGGPAWGAGDRGTAAAERARLVARARERARAASPGSAARLERLLPAAWAWAVLGEDHAHWIELRVLERVRRVLLALGDRLVGADTLERRDDVVLLTLAELREALGGMASGAAIGAAVTRRRRADLVHAAATEPSPTLGAAPAGPPADTFAGRMIVRFTGSPAPVPAEAGVLGGQAASKGLARGRARVVRRPADAGRVRQGDVLVAPTASPA
jgi:pyruvate,water dikinase